MVIANCNVDITIIKQKHRVTTYATYCSLSRMSEGANILCSGFCLSK